MTDMHPSWASALRALTALAIDPDGLSGLTIRTSAGPVRQTLETAIAQLPLPRACRIHPGLTDTQLFGGLDVTETLARGTAERHPGLADAAATLTMAMAERTPPGLAARLGQLMDMGRGHVLILLDEGADAEEIAPACLRDRLAFSANLDEVSWRDARVRLPAPADLDHARARLSQTTLNAGQVAMVVAIAVRFGIDSLRAPLLAARTARAFAALDGDPEPTDDHIREAAELVYTHRATHMPTPEDEAQGPTDPQDTQGEANESTDTTETGLPPEDMIIAAIAAMLPEDLLDRAEMRPRTRGAFGGSGAGARHKGNRRGRPLPSRPGHPGGRARIDIIATLRAAAPFQPLRKRTARTGAPRVIIYPSDIRLRRFEDRSDRLLIFAVDASGSAALARMAEAKGAVELLLARAYAKRDQVALVAFRGTEAELLLSPTRSLVQAKRRLASLPGGGGTPLAAGLRTAGELAELGRGHGLTPSLVLLTDGRGNITLQGEPGRAAARHDTEVIARQIRHLGIPGVVIDTAIRPGTEGTALARDMGAHYLALPRADAQKISAAADAALTG